MMFSFISVFTGCFKHSVFFMSYFIFPVSMVPMVSLYSFFRVLTVSIVPIVSLKQNNFFFNLFLISRNFQEEESISIDDLFPYISMYYTISV